MILRKPGLPPGQHAQIELGILKSFEFVSQLRRASVIVGQSGFSGGDIYVKGAPECMRDICRYESRQFLQIIQNFVYGC